MKKQVKYLGPGDLCLCDSGEVRTVLGSCVGVFIYDPVLNICAASHFVLPSNELKTAEGHEEFRYGDKALPYLLRKLKNKGAKRSDLLVTIIGGASTYTSLDQEVGRENIDFALEFINRFNLKIVKKDLGGPFGRNVVFDVSNGDSYVDPVISQQSQSRSISPSTLICIGASTGGVEAFTSIVKNIPETLPPIVYVQHMPKETISQYCERLDSLITPKMKVAEHWERPKYGHVYIAPGDQHLRVTHYKGHLYFEIIDSPHVNSFRPSVDVLFNSVAEHNIRVFASVLTGMGRDGAQGLLNIKKNRGETAVQDFASCVVSGMPEKAYEIGATEKILTLSEITEWLCQLKKKEAQVSG